MFPECYACIIRQSLSAVQHNTDDPEIQIRTLKEVLQILSELDDALSPSEISGETNRIIKKNTGVVDLYEKEKKASHILALNYLENLRKLLREGKDPLEQGAKISAAGNIIDIIHVSDYDLWEEVKRTVNQDLVGGGLEAFRRALESAPYLLYHADNVGETIFDRVFIESLEIPVIYVVKSGPILNDATMEDALAAGIDQVAEIVETGSCTPGTVLSQASIEFQHLFAESPLVLAKGQANYETLDEKGDKVFFLLRTKCPILSLQIEAPMGSLVLKQGKPSI
jgi:uncharacterized protein with ATP-grasp and redox domains